jgi:valyl-tRNA synthetase
MGWPEPTPTLARFYPTDVLITAADIIFFWVARMVMAGYEFMGDCPFHTVYFNSIVRDLQGRKMSKSLGNSPDPLAVMDQYGADALRFTVAASAPPGEDLRFASERTELGRNFANKIWNAARFVLQNTPSPPPPPAECALALPDRWMLSRLQAITAETGAALDEYRFNEAAMALYRFLWGEFCDWYVELSKLAFYGDDAAAKTAAQATAVYTLEQVMRLLHPFMPFVTEEVWQALPGERSAPSIMVAAYPDPEAHWIDADAEGRLAQVMELVRAVRNIRSELGIPPSASVNVRLAAAGGALSAVEPYLRALAKVEGVQYLADGERPSGEPSALVPGVGEVYVPLRGVVDLAEVRSRIERDLGKVVKELSAVQAKLARADFVDKAPAEVVEKERARAGQLGDRRAVLQRHLQSLSG